MAARWVSCVLVALSLARRSLAGVLALTLIAPLPVSAQEVDASVEGADAAAVEAAESTSPPPPPSIAAAPPERAAPALVAPDAAEVAWQELHAIQQQQEQMWPPREPGVGLAATGVAVGLPAFGVMLPIGAILVDDARSGYSGSDIAEHDRRVGATLIACGLIGLAMFVAGTIALVRIRKRRIAREAEMKSLSDRRTVLEKVVEAAWRAAPAQSAP